MAVIYPHAWPLAVLGGYRADRFVPDRALVNYCGGLRTRADVESELREFARLPENARFARRLLRVRISGRRLRRLASICWATD